MTTPLTQKEISAAYGERVLVELPAVEVFLSLGWQTANLYHETFGKNYTAERESESQVILTKRLRVALEPSFRTPTIQNWHTRRHSVRRAD